LPLGGNQKYRKEAQRRFLCLGWGRNSLVTLWYGSSDESEKT
jgi:hypothetical protein